MQESKERIKQEEYEKAKLQKQKAYQEFLKSKKKNSIQAKTQQLSFYSELEISRANQSLPLPFLRITSQCQLLDHESLNFLHQRQNQINHRGNQKQKRLKISRVKRDWREEDLGGKI